MRNNFESSCTEDGTGAGQAIFEIGFKLTASEARQKFEGTDSAVQRKEDSSASPSTQEYQKLEGKLKQDLTGEQLGSDQGATGERPGSEDRGAN